MFNSRQFHGSRALEMYLEFDYADNSRKTEILNTIPVRTVHAYEDAGQIKQENVRELLLAGTVQDTTLIQTEFYNTVMQGAEPVQCMRNFIPTITLTTGNSIQIPRGSKGAYAEDIGEGDPIVPKNNKYEPVIITVSKIGDAPLITDEMMKDSKYGLIALEVQKSGRRVENKLNRNVLKILLDSGLQTHDTQGANQGSDAALEAKSKVSDKDYIADKFVCHSRLTAKLLKELFPSANYSGYNAEALRTGKIEQTLLGMTHMETSVSMPTGNPKTWGYSSDGYYGSIVADTLNFGALVIREDIQIENFRDPMKQIQGATVTMRGKAGIMDEEAACAIIY